MFILDERWNLSGKLRSGKTYYRVSAQTDQLVIFKNHRTSSWQQGHDHDDLEQSASFS